MCSSAPRRASSSRNARMTPPMAGTGIKVLGGFRHSALSTPYSFRGWHAVALDGEQDGAEGGRDRDEHQASYEHRGRRRSRDLVGIVADAEGGADDGYEEAEQRHRGGQPQARPRADQGARWRGALLKLRGDAAQHDPLQREHK